MKGTAYDIWKWHIFSKIIECISNFIYVKTKIKKKNFGWGRKQNKTCIKKVYISFRVNKQILQSILYKIHCTKFYKILILLDFKSTWFCDFENVFLFYFRVVHFCAIPLQSMATPEELKKYFFENTCLKYLIRIKKCWKIDWPRWKSV